MRVFLNDNKQLTKYQLPSKMDDTFLINHNISGNEYSILFLKIKEELYLKSSGSVNVVLNGKEEDLVKIEYYKTYTLKIVGISDYIEACFVPNVEKLYKVSFEGIETFSIGSDASCHIQYNNQWISNVEATFKIINGEWYVSCINNDKYKVFINNFRGKVKKLKIGDIIFINGLKIIWMGSFFAVNNPNGLLKITMMKLMKDSDIVLNNIKSVSEEEKSVDLYSKDDYFTHYPIIKEKIIPKEIYVDAPPKGEKSEKIPWILTTGTTIVMLSSSFIMLYNVIYGLINGRNIASLIPQMVMCFSMLVGSLIIPRIAKKYQKKQKDNLEKLRQEKYMTYIAKKETEIQNCLNDECRILNDNYLDIDKCLITLKNKNQNFWHRQYENDDFIAIRLGMGILNSSLVVNAPEEHFALENDNLTELSWSIKKKFDKLNNVPITISLKDNNIVSIICFADNMDNYVNNLIVQLIILQSSLDLKIIIMTSVENEKRWEFAKYLPHVFSDDKTVRFFATTDDEANNISSFLENEIKERREKISNEVEKELMPYYLIITDDYKNKKNIKIIDDIVNKKVEDVGISMLVVESTIKQVPISCEVFVEIGEKEGVLIEKQSGLNQQKKFDVTDSIKEIDVYGIAKELANVPTIIKDGPSVLPTSLSFLEMYRVSKIEQLNISNRWHTSNPVVSLNAIVGVHANGDRFKLDLHEKFHGPHGLIAGMTGSGKSEFIITYILSMALTYHPYEVQFLLIDYKGGGLAGAFENKETGLKIPHLVGTITNLDVSEMNRSLISIQSELTRRQKIFNETREQLNEGTIDIYKYQRLYREGIVKKTLSHLFIICDEFAELKQQRPEFMQSLISISRIGRSLGIHLILATQKPSGLVNDQIWANSKFKVCLKVQDRSDSMEMLKRPEAASIKETGRFYLQVGYNDLFEMGQSGWSGAKYVPSDKIVLKQDESMNFINNVGYVTKTIKDIDEKEQTKKDYGEELINIVKYLHQVGEKENIKINQLWLDALPDIINISELKSKYHYAPESYYINPVIGEFDDPICQLQGILNVDLSRKGNLLIYGASGSGKENLLTTLIRSTIVEHTPDEVNIYILDCGSESLKIFQSMPHVGDVLTINERDKIVDFFELANDEIEKRKDLFADYAGSYNDYILNSGQKLPLKLFIINNYDSFSETYSNIAEKIQFLFRDGAKYGVVFVISAINANAIRTKSMQFFVNKICLKMANPEDYRTILNVSQRLALPEKFGRGFVVINDTACEFQTAMFSEKKDITNNLRELAKLLNNSYTTKALKIPTIPSVVTFDELIKLLPEGNALPIGYYLKNKNLCYYDFSKESITPIISTNINNIKMSFIFSIIRLLNTGLNNNVRVIDFANAYSDNISGIQAVKDNYDKEFVEIYNEIITSKEKNVQNYYLILGISFLKGALQSNTFELMKKIFSNIDNYNNSHFIFVDVYNAYKQVTLEEWYDQEKYQNNGIWLGENFDSQSILNNRISNFDSKILNEPYIGVIVNKGKAAAMKYVVNMEIEDE